MGKKNNLILVIFFVVGLAISNRVFNHLNAWLGILLAVLLVFAFIYQLLKNKKDEKDN